MARELKLRNIAKYGNVANLINNRMQELGWSSKEFAGKFSNPVRAVPNIHIWTSGKGAPGAGYIAEVARILKVDESQLRPNQIESKQSLIVVPKEKPKELQPIQKKTASEKVTLTIEGDLKNVTITITGKS